MADVRSSFRGTYCLHVQNNCYQVKVDVGMVRKKLVFMLYEKVAENWLTRFQGGAEAQG